jgi:hypothetical protein
MIAVNGGFTDPQKTRSLDKRQFENARNMLMEKLLYYSAPPLRWRMFRD